MHYQLHLQQTMLDETLVCQHCIPLGMTNKVVLEMVDRTLRKRQNTDFELHFLQDLVDAILQCENSIKEIDFKEKFI